MAKAFKLYRGLSLLEISQETQVHVAEVSSRQQSPSEVYTCQKL